MREYTAAHPDDPEGKALEELFEIRYTVTGVRKKMVRDNFLRLWFDLVIYGKQCQRRSEIKLAQRELDKFFDDPRLKAFLEKWQMGQAVLERELRNAVYVYFEASREDKNYTSKMLNLLRLKKEDVEAKAAGDAVMGSWAILDTAGRADRYPLLIQVAKEGFLMAFPDGVAAYNRLYNAWKENVGKQ